MKRAEWKHRADDLAASAATLLYEKHYSTAFYLAGLSVECALKAKIASRFLASDIPDRRLVQAVYDHDLSKLLGHAQLSDLLDADGALKPRLKTNWNLVKTWSVEARYASWSPTQADDMIRSVSERGTGVLSWIKRHW